MEGLYPITDRDKATAMELIIYEILDDIEKRANKWFVDAFIERYLNKRYVNKKLRFDNLLVDNLISDLEYQFSMAFWWIEVAENMNLNIESKRFVIRKYERFKQNEYGYRFLVSDERYDANTNSFLTEEEIAERKEKVNAELIKILSEM